MSVLLDTRPLRESPAFRRLWLGTSVSRIGGAFGTFAATYAVWELSHSTLLVGLLGLVGAVAWVVAASVGSAFIDSVDRAALARGVLRCQVVLALGLAVAAYAGSVVALIALVAIKSSLSALGDPAQRALVSHLVPPGRLAAALALNALAFQTAMLIGPALAGLLTAATSVEACFVFDAVTFAVALLGLRGLSARPDADGSPARGWSAVREGLAFAVRRPVVRGALLSDLAAMVLAMPIALFPAINEERFGGDPATLGLFTTAVAVGGVVGTTLSGTVTHRRRPGLVMTLCVALWGGAMVVAGLADLLPVLLAALAVGGLADTWSVVSRGALVQGSTPDGLRGRVSALEQVVGVAGPDLGNFRAGALAPLLGAGPTMAVGGLSCLAAGWLIYLLIPRLRRWEVPADRVSV